MHPDTPIDWWWVILIMVGAVAMVCWKLILNLFRGGDTENPLPSVDRTPRMATVVGRELAPRKRPRRSPNWTRLPGDLWLVQVEYRDADGAVRKEFLADVIHDDDMHRFRIGTEWQVYGFETPRATTRRCLLTEAHDGVPRSGYNLDGVRVRGAERQLWQARRGSPFFGMMAFRNDATWYSEPITGRRTSWPGDPTETWAASGGTSEDFIRPRPVPVVESAEQVSRWMDPSRLANTGTYAAPIFWVFLPIAALGFLIYGAVIDPAGFGVSGNFFGETMTGELWDFWLVWTGVLIWLLIAIGVLVYRVRFYPRWRRESAKWTLEHAIVCEVHRSPYAFGGGEGSDVPGRILIDNRLPDGQAARIVRAFRDWVSHGDVERELGYGSLHDYGCIASAELFGPGAAGGYFAASDAEEGGWVLLTEIREDAREGDEPPWRSADLTTIPGS